MITEILPSTLAVLGAAGFDDTLALGDRIGPVRRVAVVLVDGLGWHLLARAAEHSPFLADVLAGRIGQVCELASTLPSTTPTSLVSLGTGAQPGQHGIVGFTVNVPGTDRVLKHITWRDDPDPARWQPVPTVYERATGVPSAVVLPAAFQHSGLTVSAYRGARYVPLTRGDDLADTVLATLTARPGLVYSYTARVDTAAHVHGIASPQWADAVATTGVLLARLVAQLPDDAALLVTADHGGLDVPAAGRVDLDTDPRLSAGIRVVAGEPRLRYLHTIDGATPDVLAAWTDVLGRRASVLDRDEAIASGMFGEVCDSHRARIGDIVVVCVDDTVVLATGHESPDVAKLIGFHGSATAAETAIPLITIAGDYPLARNRVTT
ncbi:MAG: alkaline phosphatase family protein [Jatrophihabitantaceae bacterium]